MQWSTEAGLFLRNAVHGIDKSGTQPLGCEVATHRSDPLRGQTNLPMARCGSLPFGVAHP
jgi:hypothetical protein